MSVKPIVRRLCGGCQFYRPKQKHVEGDRLEFGICCGWVYRLPDGKVDGERLVKRSGSCRRWQAKEAR